MTCQEYLISHWLQEIKYESSPYKEPILDELMVDKIKLFCDALQQDSHVFIMTVEIIEEYITVKNSRKLKILDPFLVIITAIFIASKFTGELLDYKSGSLINIYEKLCFKKISNRKIKMQEIDTLETIEYHLPLYTCIDDLKTFLHYYMSQFKLKFDLTYLCEELLNFFTIYKLRIFITLKVHYLQNINAINAFSIIYTNRMYVPISILLCAFKITKISNVISTAQVIKELSNISNIHSDHFRFLCEEIYKIWKLRKENNGL